MSLADVVEHPSTVSTSVPSFTAHDGPTISLRRSRPAVSALAEEAFHGIAGRIANGIYQPGDRISDKQLAQEFGFSRTPVREALQRLERIGLVEMHPSRYTVVTAITPEMARATWEFTGLFAGNVVRLAFPRLGETERAQVVELIAAAIEKVPSNAEWLTAQIALFGYLADRAHNDLYRSLLGDSWYLILRNLARIGISPAGQAESIRALHLLSDAFVEGDLLAAERAAQRVYGLA
ncbi:GntR family transcriptional regulator [Microbacterium sp. XT11]|uniref:GntR family transcriptional regulator n=1 Tax=Microbacterium sp. XT11 TaxID=367477 RepID=UPI000831F4CA|nr:GntR family transcriptional regulator [Microbacterium sp. XT11]